VTNRPHPKKDKNRNYAPLFTYLKVCFALIYSLTIFWTIKRGAEYLLLTSTYPGSVLPSTTGYESLSCDGIISPTNADLRIGEQVTFTATPGGGSGDFKYYWGIDPLAGYFDTTDLGLDSRDPSATWHANYSVIQDNYSIRVEIIDQETKEKCTARAPITISARQDLSCEGALSPTNISLKENETVTFTANPQGGTGYYKYFWGIIPTEGYFTGSTPSSSPSTTWHAPQIDQDSKTYTLWLELYDKVSGVNCKTETVVTVNRAYSPLVCGDIISPRSIELNTDERQEFTLSVSGGSGSFASWVTMSPQSGYFTSSDNQRQIIWYATNTTPGSTQTLNVKIEDNMTHETCQDHITVKIKDAPTATIDTPESETTADGERRRPIPTTTPKTTRPSYQRAQPTAKRPTAEKAERAKIELPKKTETPTVASQKEKGIIDRFSQWSANIVETFLEFFSGLFQR